jgi:hypothetical protein
MQKVRISRIEYGIYDDTATMEPHPTVFFAVAHRHGEVEIPVSVFRGKDVLASDVSICQDDDIIKSARKKFVDLIEEIALECRKVET